MASLLNNKKNAGWVLVGRYVAVVVVILFWLDAMLLLLLLFLFLLDTMCGDKC